VKNVSVIIPTFNYGRYLRDAVDSVLAQTRPALEILVIDDGSSDDTADVAASYGDRIRFIRQQHAGVCAARNNGIANARGEYVAFLDSDDVWLPSKIEQQLARFEADPKLGLVHCGAERFDQTGTLAVNLDGREGWIAPQLLSLDAEVIAAGSAIMVPKRIAEEIGGFDTGLAQAEDWDFAYRIAVHHRVGFVREVLVRYRQHERGNHLNVPRMELDMLTALRKAFASADPEVQSMRRFTYGRVHRILAGCYFQERAPKLFFRHMLKSLRYDPRNVGYFAAYPLRAALRAVGVTSRKTT
jgi:glycosyltransferase involved in cell wall biosynthesis